MTSAITSQGAHGLGGSTAFVFIFQRDENLLGFCVAIHRLQCFDGGGALLGCEPARFLMIRGQLSIAA
jgi:hypothetical protein